MATFNTVWSLDVGHSSLKAVRLRRDRNNLEILAVDKVDYSVGPNGIDFPKESQDAIGAFKVRNEVRDPIILAHSGRGTLSRFIRVPAFDPRKIREMVHYEASQQIPFPLDEVIWDYHILQRDYLPGEEREVGLFAARREAIDDYLLEYNTGDLVVEALPIGYLGLVNFVLYDIAPEEPTVVLDIGASHTDLILVEGRKFWTRALPFSGNDINKAIMDRFKLSFPEAEKLKLECAKNPKQAVKIFSAIIQPKLRDLVGDIHRTIGYYRSQSGDVQFKQLYLLGNGSKLLGLKKFLGEHLGLRVNRLQTINHIRINREVNLKMLQVNLPAFGTALGCVLQGVGMGHCKVDLVPQEEKLQKEYERQKKHVFIALGILFLVTFLAFFMVKAKVDDAETSLREAGTFLGPIERDEKKLKALEGGENTREAEILVGVAKLRKQPIESLRHVGKILSKLSLDRNISVTHPEEKREKRLPDVTSESLKLLNEKVWVPYWSVEKVEWPEAVQKIGGRRKEKRNTVPAYKVTVFAVVAMQQNPEESYNLLRKLFITPLEKELERSKLSLDPKVSVKPMAEAERTLTSLYYTGKPGTVRGQKRPKEQVGAPFYGTEVYWYLRLEKPPDEQDPNGALKG